MAGETRASKEDSRPPVEKEAERKNKKEQRRKKREAEVAQARHRTPSDDETTTDMPGTDAEEWRVVRPKSPRKNSQGAKKDESAADSDNTSIMEVEVVKSGGNKKRARQASSGDDAKTGKEALADRAAQPKVRLVKLPAANKQITATEEKCGKTKPAPSDEAQAESRAPKSLEDVRDMAAKATDEILAYCLTPENEIGKRHAQYLMSRVSTLHELIGRVVLRCGRLEGRLQERPTATATAAVRPSPAPTPTPTPTSYATAARGGRAPTAIVTTPATRITPPATITARRTTVATVIQNAAKAPARNEILIRPAEGAKIESSEATKKALMAVVNPAVEKIGVKSVRLTRDNGVIVETTQAEHLKVFLNNSRLKEAGLEAARPMGAKPRVIIYDVPSYTLAEEIAANIAAQNSLGVDNVSQHIRPVFKTGEKNRDTVHWVVEVSAEMRKKLLQTERVNVGWKNCRVRDYLEVQRCFNCQGYGHVAKHCGQKEEVCKHCTKTGHRRADCPEKEKAAVCANCKKAHRDCKHSTGSKKCPSYAIALQRKASLIKYD